MDASKTKIAATAAMPTPSKTRRLTVGAASGMISALAFQPLDVFRTQQQGAFVSQLPHAAHTTSGLRTFVASLRSVGLASRVHAMWRGSVVTLFRVASGAGLYFLTLDLSLEAVPTSTINTFIAGSFARAFAGVVTSPLTVLKARMEWQPPGSRITNMQMLQEVLRTEGSQGLWRGLVPTLLRDVPFSGIYVVIYKRVQATANAHASDTRIPKYATDFGSGVIAGALATTVVHPADVVKTRMQLALMVHTEKAPIVNLKNSLTCAETIRKIWREEGWAAFAKGIVPRVAKRTLATAVTWTLYDHFAVSSKA